MIPVDLAVTRLVCFTYHSHARLWVHWAPGIPHALVFLGERFMHNSGASRRGNAKSYLPGCLKIESEQLRFRVQPVTPVALRDCEEAWWRL